MPPNVAPPPLLHEQMYQMVKHPDNIRNRHRRSDRPGVQSVREQLFETVLTNHYNNDQREASRYETMIMYPLASKLLNNVMLL